MQDDFNQTHIKKHCIAQISDEQNITAIKFICLILYLVDLFIIFFYFQIFIGVCVGMLSHVQFFATPRTVGCRLLLSMGLSRQEYWSGLPLPLPGHLPNQGTEPMSLAYTALAGSFFTTSTTYEALIGAQLI